MESGQRILIVEDSTIQREVLRRLLSKAGYNALAARDGAEGLAMAREYHPRVVVSDIAMPFEDGYSLIQRVRAREAISPAPMKMLPAIALTGHAKPSDEGRALAAGFQMHFAKPVAPAALLRAIASLTR